jgi:hypothetical protein
VPGCTLTTTPFDDQVDAATCAAGLAWSSRKSDQRRNPRLDKVADWQRDRVERTSNGSSSTGGSPPGSSSGEQRPGDGDDAVLLLLL